MLMEFGVGCRVFVYLSNMTNISKNKFIECKL